MRCTLTRLALLLPALSALRAQTPAASPDFFETKIRPILANSCYSCHAGTAMGGLRLDSSEAMLKGGTHGPAIVPGDPDKSLLIAAVRQTDAKLKMPMGGKLKDSEVEDLTAWVKAGAVWPAAPAAVTSATKPGDKYVIPPERKNFWSLLPLSEPKPPAVATPRWAKTDIDRFVLAKLEKEGLKPVRPATRLDLIRRATLDLTGLPPTPEEISAFEKDTAPDAFAKVVDRLLASPHYGERWGRFWLDVARYGEDDYRSLNPNPRGYHPYPNAYVYRDWVVQAFNDDLPYDQFVKAQLAGDLLDEKTRYKTLPATGFLGLGPWYYDNGSVEVTRADERHDRVDVVTRGFLGLTVACARCHDHKYDPIPTTDYYALAGVFLNTAYHEYPTVPKKVLDQYTKVEEEIEKKQKVLGELQQNLGNQLSNSLAFQTSNYLQAVYEVVAQKKEAENVVEQRKLDFELLQRWIRYMEKPTDKYKFKQDWQALMKRATATLGAGRRGGMTDSAPPTGTAPSTDAAPATPPTTPPATPPTPPTKPAATETPADTADGAPASKAIAPPPATPAAPPVTTAAGGGGVGGGFPGFGGGGGGRGGRGGPGGGVSPEVKKLADEFQANVVRVMLARRDLTEENDIISAKALEGTTKKKRANKPNEFITNDDFCPGCGLPLKNMPEDETSFFTEVFQRELTDADDPAAMMAMGGGRGGRPGVLLFRGWGLESRTGAQAQQQIAAIRTDIEEARKKLDPAYPFLHGVQDAAKPINLQQAIRGNPENLGPEVTRHGLSLLSKADPAPYSKGSGRLELADDIIHQPIALRVFVNRVWKGHFGTGIVDTPSNFGLTGERPTNPELLEYLAARFSKDGMSLKKLHREIMLSTVYQLSSENDEADYAKDSGDRFYWRFERKRLDAEQLRDGVMMVAGNLDHALGGPSEDLTPAMTRRTLYGKVSRYKLDEYLQLFDFPTPIISAEKRFTTTVPQQRLFLMNSDFMAVETEELAKRIAPEPDNRARVRKAYHLIFGRDPKEDEVKLAIAYLHEEPLKEYEEAKSKPADGAGRGGRGAGAPSADAEMPPTEGAPATPMGMGMMGGMGRRGGAGRPPEVKYDPTAWGRYLKVLFSSSEFMFIQ